MVEQMENVFSNDWTRSQDRPGYTWNSIRFAKKLGGELLGASIYVLPPGQKSFPYHFHHANEEMLIVFEGDVIVRTPEGEVEATVGDSMIFNKGPGGAHQVINRSESDARIMMLSSMVGPEIAEYPDSGNIGVFDLQAGPDGKPLLAKFLDGSAESDYFKGED